MPVAFDYLIAQRANWQKRPVDQLLSWLAERQHGTASRRQLQAAGLSSAAIGRRITAGSLRPLYDGVYAIGHRRLTREGELMAAVLSLGEKSTVSHRAAMSFQKLGAWSGFPELTIPSPRRSRPGLILHTATLPPDEVMHLDGIPITKPSRTLLDLAGVLDEQGLRRALTRPPT
jgi:hypothetical protein